MGEIEGQVKAEVDEGLPDDQLFSETTAQDGMVPGLQFSEDDAGGDALPAELPGIIIKDEAADDLAEADASVKVTCTNQHIAVVCFMCWRATGM